MKAIIVIAALGFVASTNAQLWNGDPLPDPWGGTYVIDPYFVPGGGGLSEFDQDTGIDFSLDEFGTHPLGITEDNGWVDASTFNMALQEGDIVKITYLGNTAGWDNDFGMNRGGMNASGDTASTIFASINSNTPDFGSQTGFTQASGDPTSIDFWLNSNQGDMGGTYSVFNPETSEPSNTGLPGFDYSARGKVFNVFDDTSGTNRSILVVALEDWRNFDADFTDLFFAIEIGNRFGGPQFPVPEPSTYGLIGAMLLMALVAVRRIRHA